MTVASGLAAVRERIARAAAACGRDPASIALVAVSKTQPAQALRDAWAAGQRDFGENYVQELLAKCEALADLADVRWHVIGHVQSRKARDVARVATVVHSIDSAKLAIELGARAAGEGRTLDALVQVNVGGEAQKSGCAPAELGRVLDAIAHARALRLRGLMTVPPETEDPAGAAPFFESLARLRDAHGGAAALPELSMGMSHDLETAVACGATIVRIGTAVFGARPTAA